jgi:hypothetical protein
MDTAYLKRNWWKIAYVFAGPVYLGLTRGRLDFWVRYPLFALWGVGLAFLFVHVLESQDREKKNRDDQR